MDPAEDANEAAWQKRHPVNGSSEMFDRDYTRLAQGEKRLLEIGQAYYTQVIMFREEMQF